MFSEYWDDTYTLKNVVKDERKEYLYPGNPVYQVFEDGKHIGICVGYDSAGEPILCAHTKNRKNVPASGWFNNATVYTLLFNTSRTFTTNKDTPSVYTQAGALNDITKYIYTGVLSQGESQYFYFTVAKAGFYDVYTTGGMHTQGYSYIVSNETLHPWYVDKLILGDCDEVSGQNFSLYNYYEPGYTYCIEVKSCGNSNTFNLFIEYFQ